MAGEVGLRSRRLLDRHRSALWAVDLQTRLLAALPGGTTAAVADCIRAASLLSVPVFATTQYEGGLGGLDPQIQRALADAPRWDKRAFSAAAVPELMAHVAEKEREQIVLCGIETHICVLQTALDLLARGYEVAVVVDAVAAGRPLDHQYGLRRMSDEGVILVTREALMMEWLESSAAPEFKAISGLIKEIRARDAAGTSMEFEG
jgi:hypothetical protein